MRRTVLVLLTAATLALSTGCATSPATDPDADRLDPSLATDCSALRRPLENLDTAVTDATAMLYDDAAGAGALLTGVATPFSDATTVVENAELREIAEPIDDAVIRLADAMTAYGTDPSEQNAGVVLDTTTEITDQVALIDDYCSTP
jgi:hypothetical protein